MVNIVKLFIGLYKAFARKQVPLRYIPSPLYSYAYKWNVTASASMYSSPRSSVGKFRVLKYEQIIQAERTSRLAFCWAQGRSYVDGRLGSLRSSEFFHKQSCGCIRYYYIIIVINDINHNHK